MVAEGVEFEDELLVLRDIGGIQLQGFLLGRPMPEHELLTRLPPRSGDVAESSVPAGSPIGD